MAFVKAIKDGHIIKVSRKSFESMFADKGYVLLKEDKAAEKAANSSSEEVMEEEEVEQDESVDTIPISEMSREQLMEFAREHNIDTSKAKNVREARQIIQKAVRESKM